MAAEAAAMSAKHMAWMVETLRAHGGKCTYGDLVAVGETHHCDTVGALLKILKNRKRITFKGQFLMFPADAAVKVKLRDEVAALSEAQSKKKKKKVPRQRASSSDLFSQHDVDGDGFLDVTELGGLLEEINPGVKLEAEQVKCVMRAMAIPNKKMRGRPQSTRISKGEFEGWRLKSAAVPRKTSLLEEEDEVESEEDVDEDVEASSSAAVAERGRGDGGEADASSESDAEETISAGLFDLRTILVASGFGADGRERYGSDRRGDLPPVVVEALNIILGDDAAANSSLILANLLSTRPS
jgi:hypothetical protein